MPRADAEQARYHPPARFQLLALWCLVQDAAEGKPGARQALDQIRDAYARHGAVGEALDAMEQPAHASELQALLGID
jgi:hypothetical protein